ncbi:MAG TPA: serine hydrolase domain-containing protein [Thermoanaerobaculia bacterium]|jgi:CubicO group peptidase (beta-lactamase class C family)
MSKGGFSAARLGRIHDVMAGYVERGVVPGLVTLVSRRGEAHVEAIGTKAIDGSEPMRRDTIFRITSMTKPVTAVAAMILVEECRLRLDDPVDRLLPELADRRVLKSVDGPLDDTVPANRPITVRDLLTFRLGFGMLMRPSESTPIQRAQVEQELRSIGPPMPPIPHAPDEWMRRLGTLPLMFQPGERWLYNTGAHVLGVLIARASGQPLEDFFSERIFEPLGMKDTGFSVPAAKFDRFASCYRAGETGELALQDGVEESQWSRPPIFPDAAAGLVSTVGDYLAFGQMLLNQGSLGDERVLSRLSVEAMTTDQMRPGQAVGAEFLPGEGAGWGFGVSIVNRRDSLYTVPGSYGWNGGFGTCWSNDPEEGMVTILMTQRLWDSPSPPEILRDFLTSAYQAIGD